MSNSVHQNGVFVVGEEEQNKSNHSVNFYSNPDDKSKANSAVDRRKQRIAPGPIIVEEDEPEEKTGRKCCRFGPKVWCKKYFWEGQELTTSKDDLDKKLQMMSRSERFFAKYRRVIGFAIPVVIWHFFWWALFVERGFWKEKYFPSKYPLTLTMIAGGTIAGMTSVGGGAVAFPVLTLVLKVPPPIARDVALMIQSSGMTAASFSIFFMKVCVEWHALVLCTVGSLAGIILGHHVVDPAMGPSVKKLTFVSIWLSFAFVLVILNRTNKRRTFNVIPNFNWWKGLTLVIGGFIGGIFTAFAGTGLDICAFMVLTLLFRISEKVATPTTVILMAFNSVIALYWRANMIGDVTDEAWEYISVCFPIVTLMAPLGSILGTHFHRLVLAALVIILNIIAFILAFVIVRPLTPVLIGMSVGILVGCFAVFLLMTFAGQKLLDRIEDDTPKLQENRFSCQFTQQGKLSRVRRYSIDVTVTDDSVCKINDDIDVEGYDNEAYDTEENSSEL